MTYISNPPISSDDRKRLRRESSFCEVLLWIELKNRKMQGYKFRRQFGIGNFIVDFYCPELKLAIEVDGETHYGDENQNRDRWREKQIAKFSEITFLRFYNEDILGNMASVLEFISQQIDVIKAEKQRGPL